MAAEGSEKKPLESPYYDALSDYLLQLNLDGSCHDLDNPPEVISKLWNYLTDLMKTLGYIPISYKQFVALCEEDIKIFGNDDCCSGGESVPDKIKERLRHLEIPVPRSVSKLHTVFNHPDSKYFTQFEKSAIKHLLDQIKLVPVCARYCIPCRLEMILSMTISLLSSESARDYPEIGKYKIVASRGYPDPEFEFGWIFRLISGTFRLRWNGRANRDTLLIRLVYDLRNDGWRGLELAPI